jgi:hypothetical protein
MSARGADGCGLGQFSGVDWTTEVRAISRLLESKGGGPLRKSLRRSCKTRENETTGLVHRRLADRDADDLIVVELVLDANLARPLPGSLEALNCSELFSSCVSRNASPNTIAFCPVICKPTNLWAS